MKKLRRFFDREQNLLIHFAATLLVTIMGIILNLSFNEFIVVYVMCGFVISTELFNSAIELAVDNYTLKYNEKARVAKDTAAAAVLMSALTALLVGLYIFLPKIILLIK